MRFLYKPFGIIAGIIAARLGRGVFRSLWSRIDAAEPPTPDRPEGSMTKVVGAAALEAATMAGVAAAVNRASASVFAYLTGSWPGKQREEDEEEE